MIKSVVGEVHLLPAFLPVRLIVLLLRCVSTSVGASGGALLHRQQQPAADVEEDCSHQLSPQEGDDGVAMVAGLLEVAVILWKGIIVSLECDKNAHFRKRLETEAEVSLPLLFNVFTVRRRMAMIRMSCCEHHGSARPEWASSPLSLPVGLFPATNKGHTID